MKNRTRNRIDKLPVAAAGKQAPKVLLRIRGTAGAGTATDIHGWRSESWVIEDRVRGAASAAAQVELAPDAVLELQLENGNRILVSAEDAGRYLGDAVGRGADGGAQLEAGAVLHLRGTRTPAGLARDGLGAWILKALRIYPAGPAGMTALAAAGTFQDAALENRNGLYRCGSDALSFAAVDILPASDQPNLLFIHGTASSTAGSFGELWRNAAYRTRLAQAYGARIFAFEHRSLTESPIANALALVKALPRGARLHIVSHSRGGLVGELLARTARKGAAPFTDEEIERFLDHAKRIGRDGYQEDARRLRELGAELSRRAICVERFARVACPARGTTLASGRLDRWASVMLNLVGKGIEATGAAIPLLAPIAGGYGLFRNFLLAVVKERCDARVLPGLEAMMPDSPLVDLLNDPGVELDAALHVLAGDFAGDGLLSWLGDCLSEVFYGGETDLVVNTPSMGGGAKRSAGIFCKPLQGPAVNHFSYFERDESALPLLDALEGRNDAFQSLDGPSRAAISRGGKKDRRKEDAPIVLMLPGIMGSHLQIGRNRIWFDPVNLWVGQIDRLALDAPVVAPDGWMDRSYEDLADYLAASHEVRPFAYDWRLSIAAEARRFGETVLDPAMADARLRRQPLRIVAHSMGGLVARMALNARGRAGGSRWEEFKSLPGGSRLLQLGTPNNGSHSIAAVLMGRDDFVQSIERWFDFRHDMKEFLAVVRDFPGVLELLPWPDDQGRASDGEDYFDAAAWQRRYDEDRDPDKEKCWIPPQEEALKKARAAVELMRSLPLEKDFTLYVAGCGSTPVATRIADGRIEIGWTEQGDGRVPWNTGIPPGVPVWYAQAKHGDLASHKDAFAAYKELLETGDTRQDALSRTPRIARAAATPVFRARALRCQSLYPSNDEVLAAAMGGERPHYRVPASTELPAQVEIVHGSPADSDAPVLIGAYANDSLRGTAKFMDAHLGGQLARTHGIGRYPGRPDQAIVFRHHAPYGKPGGAIVVGLGAVGEVTPGKLVQALCEGLLEYARVGGDGAATAVSLDVGGLLVGTGFGGLSVELGMQCQVEALCRANRALALAGANARIARLTLYEESQERALAAAQALHELVAHPVFAPALRFEGRVRQGIGGYRGRCAASGGEPGGYRVHIVHDPAGGGLLFTVIGDRARNEVVAEADQRRAVDGMIASATQTTYNQPGLSRAMFELMVPNGMKETVGNVRALILSVDAAAAVYPWELMRDAEAANAEPLAVRIELVRQFASAHGRGRVPLVQNRRAFVVGDTQSGFPELLGAQEEARCVAAAFAANGLDEVHALYRADAEQVYQGLLNHGYRFMHIAAHGVVEDKKSGLTGIVLGPDAILTTAQVAKIARVPEFVFLNCCHLGSMAEDAKPRWGELAAGLATQFIEMGCKAVIAAGWAVDDAAASTFATTFYSAMFDGKRFGQAVRSARRATYEQHPLHNTWGAYQAYGDEQYRFPVGEADGVESGEYLHAAQLLADVEMLAARLEAATEDERGKYYAKKLRTLETAAQRPGLRSAAVLEQLGRAWANLGDKAAAIERYRAALAAEDASVSVRALERLAQLEIRYGAELLRTKGSGHRKEAIAFVLAGGEHLRQLLDVGMTVERGLLLGSYWKKLATVAHGVAGLPSVDACLANMQLAYWKAAALSRSRDGEWDHAALLNALESDILLAARGQREKFDAHAADLSALLEAASANARRRFADDRRLRHAVAEIDAARIRALWHCFEKPAPAAAPAAFAELAGRYLDVFRRIGSRSEIDSTIEHLQSLHDLLPVGGAADKARTAMATLIAEVAGGSGVGPH